MSVNFVKILYITHSCPYPPNKGDRIRSFHLLHHLANKYDVTLLYPIFSRSDSEHREVLQRYCAAVYAVNHSPFLATLKCLLALFKGQPLTLAHFDSRQLREIVERENFDVALADCSSMAQYVLALSQPKVVDLVDVDSEKWKMYSKKTFFPFSWIYGLEAQRLREFEAKIVKHTEACLVTSERERQCLDASDHVFVVPNGVDLSYFSPNANGLARESATLLFIGAMNYFANVDGVLFFYNEIFPLIKRKVPSVKFIIAGMHPTKTIQRLAGPDTIVTGYVPDIRPYLNEATVCVVPLWIARGVQNKVLEAMAMNVPVVATSMANAGIRAKDGQDILLADDPEEFSKSVVVLLKDSNFRDKLALSARQLVEDSFSWEHSLKKLDEAIGLATCL